jgi:hypothetical protein
MRAGLRVPSVEVCETPRAGIRVNVEMDWGITLFLLAVVHLVAAGMLLALWSVSHRR